MNAPTKSSKPVAYTVHGQNAGYSSGAEKFTHPVNARKHAWEAVAYEVARLVRDGATKAFVWTERDGVKVWSAIPNSTEWNERLAWHTANQAAMIARRAVAA
jgi:hypothetical protein